MDKSFSWEKIGRICMYLLFGLVPVFFLPLTSFPVAENKQALTGILIFVALGAWFAQTLNTGKISIPKTRLWFVAAAFFVILGISTALSSSPQTSLWGNLTSPDSFFNFLLYGLALFLIPMYLREISHLIRALLFFSIALLALSVYSLLQFFGVYLLPFEFTKAVSFNPIGTTQGLAIFLGAGLVMIMALLTSFKLSQMLKMMFVFGAALLAFILILVNFSYVWLGILIASALVVSWQVMQSRRQLPTANYQQPTESEVGSGKLGAASADAAPAGAMLAPKFGLPLVMMIVVAILFFVQPPISSIVQLPAEVRPSFSATLEIARAGFSASPAHIAFGSGPATFLYEYLMHRSTDLNATAFWGVRFTEGFSTMVTMLTTIGILGVAGLLGIFGFFIVVGFRGVAALSRKDTAASSEPSHGSAEGAGGKPAERIALISFVSFIFLFLSWFYYPTGFSVFLFTFVFAGMVIAALRAGGSLESWNISLLSTPQRTFVASLIVIVLIVGVVVGVYWQGQKYVASVYHTFGVQAYNQERNVDEALRLVSLAVNLDASRDIYWRTFTQLLGLRTQGVLSNEQLDQVERQRQYQVALQNAIQAGQQATKVNPADPLNWRQLAAVYEDNAVIVKGADRFAAINYEEATKRNPQNPQEFLNVGRSYIRSADAVQSRIIELGRQDRVANAAEIEGLQGEMAETLAKALEALQKAISLKGDYSPAHFLASQVYERQGQRTLAIQKTVETRDLNPQDTGVGYQLGLLYYLDNQMEKAREEFFRVVTLDTQFSNARYFLGLIYDRLGNKEAAIEQFVEIEKYNAGNSEVERILVNLRAGKDALANIVPPAAPPEARIEPPVQETGGATTQDFVKPKGETSGEE